MALSNVYSTTVKSKDYKIYLTNVASTVKVYDGAADTTIAERVIKTDGSDGNEIANLLTLTDITAGPTAKPIFNEVGELRKDSIVNTISEGNTVEGNNLGKIVIDKNGELVFEIIARNKALLDQLDTIDSQEDPRVCVLKVDKDLTEGKFYADLPFRYNESSTGGEVSAITLTFKKMVDSADDFSTLLPVPVV